jgi:hypothetical protein
MSKPARTMSALRQLGWSAVLAGAASWALADDSAARRLVEFGDATVSLAWSASWRLESTPHGQVPPGTVEIHAADRLQMMTLLTPIGMPGLTADAAMQDLVTKSSQQFEGQAVEKEIKLQRISSSEAHGYFVCVTDKAPKPDEYKFLCQGVVTVRDLPISFTVLYNDGGKADAERMLSGLKTLQAAKQT